MEIVLHPTLPSQIIAGYRAPSGGPLADPNSAQRVLTGIVKGTYQAGGTQVTLAAAQLPIFDQDIFFGPAPQGPIRYEHDLAIYKPRADVVILGSQAPPQANPIGGWEERVVIGATTMTARFSAVGALTHFDGAPLAPSAVPWSSATPVTIGWQNRVVDGGSNPTRLNYAGVGLATFNHSTMKLPQNFNNLFFNGGLYSGVQPVFAHITANLITVQAAATYDDGNGGVETITRTTPLHLPAPPPMTVTYRTSASPDAPTTDASAAMSLDTLVYEKAAAQFYAVWRGVWADLEAVGFGRLVRVALA